jgi:hypothetical protein
MLILVNQRKKYHMGPLICNICTLSLVQPELKCFANSFPSPAGSNCPFCVHL